MAKVKTETRIGLTPLQTGNRVTLYGQKVEFVCEYKNRLIFYSDEANCTTDIPADLTKIQVDREQKLGNNCVGKLF